MKHIFQPVKEDFIFAPRLAVIDLTMKASSVEEIPLEIYAQYLGGRGINTYLLAKHLPFDVDPLSAENILLFAPGTLNGTIAPSSGRTTVTSKSPVTGLYVKSSVGGFWGSELRRAGIDVIMVKGSSDKPCYITIKDGKIEIKDAALLWGLDVPETNKKIWDVENDHAMQIACIGPAGENLVSMACIMFSVWNAAARSGTGTVMGSKNLKAIAVRGTKNIDIKNLHNFIQTSYSAQQELKEDPIAQSLQLVGTAGITTANNALGILPSYNYQTGSIEGAQTLGGDYLIEAGYLKSRLSCGSCPISCHRFTEIVEGPHAGVKAGGPEFETTSSLGSGCGVTNTGSMLKANQLCNILGMDTISAGNVIQWTMECCERGVLTPAEIGMELTWGNGDAMVSMVTAIAYKQGFGAILAKGLHEAAKEVGKGSWRWAVESKKLDQSRVDVRSRMAYALGFAVNPRGPDHLHSEAVAESGKSPAARALVKKICGSETYAKAYSVEKKPELLKWHEECYAITDALGFCAFVTTMAYAVNPENMAALCTYATGIKLSETAIMEIGDRIVNLEKAINAVFGATRQDDKLPWRMMNEPLVLPNGDKLTVDKEKLDGMLDIYYALHEWDVNSGNPTKEKLKKLGVEWIYDRKGW